MSQCRPNKNQQLTRADILKILRVLSSFLKIEEFSPLEQILSIISETACPRQPIHTRLQLKAN